MKIIKRITGGILSVIMLIMCLGITAFADNGTVNTGTIIVRNDRRTTNISIAGRTYSAYKVFDLVQNDDRTSYTYLLNDEFDHFFKSDQFAAAFITGAADEISELAEIVRDNSTSTSAMSKFITAIGANSANLNKFADAVYKFAGEKRIAPANSADAEVEIDTETGEETGYETAVISGLELGYYLVYGEGSALNAPEAEEPGTDLSNVVTACILDSTRWNENENDYVIVIDVKVGVPTVEKKIVQNAGNNEKLVDADSAGIGGKVDFRVSATVPDLSGYTAYTFKITDTLSKGLTFNNDVVVKINGAVIDPSKNAYKVEAVVDNTSGVTTITIDFNDFYKFITDGKYSHGSIITYDYSATLNEDAVIGTLGNPNKVKLTYSNDPYDDTSSNDTVEDTVKVYTFEFDIYKFTGIFTEGNALAGAEFQLKKSGSSAPLKFVLKDGKYYLTSPAEEQSSGSETDTLVSDPTGYIKIYGLGAGTYTLTETKPPEGYEILWHSIEIKIEPVYDETATTELDSLKAPAKGAEYGILTKGSGTDTEYLGVQCSIENSRLTRLVSTGGIGTAVFYVAGAALMILAIVILGAASKRRPAK